MMMMMMILLLTSGHACFKIGPSTLRSLVQTSSGPAPGPKNVRCAGTEYGFDAVVPLIQTGDDRAGKLVANQ